MKVWVKVISAVMPLLAMGAAQAQQTGLCANTGQTLGVCETICDHPHAGGQDLSGQGLASSSCTSSASFSSTLVEDIVCNCRGTIDPKLVSVYKERDMPKYRQLVNTFCQQRCAARGKAWSANNGSVSYITSVAPVVAKFRCVCSI